MQQLNLIICYYFIILCIHKSIRYNILLAFNFFCNFTIIEYKSALRFDTYPFVSNVSDFEDKIKRFYELIIYFKTYVSTKKC